MNPNDGGDHSSCTSGINSNDGVLKPKHNISEGKEDPKHNLQQVIDSLIGLGMLDVAEVVRERIAETTIPVCLHPNAAGPLQPTTVGEEVLRTSSEAPMEGREDHEESESKFDPRHNVEEEGSEKVQQKSKIIKSNTFDNVTSIDAADDYPIEQTNPMNNGTTHTPNTELHSMRNLLKTEKDILAFRENLLLAITMDPCKQEQPERTNCTTNTTIASRTTTGCTNHNITPLFGPSIVELIQQWVHNRLSPIVSPQGANEYKTVGNKTVNERNHSLLPTTPSGTEDSDALVDGLVNASLVHVLTGSCIGEAQERYSQGSEYIRTTLECYWRRELLIAWCGCVMSPALLTLISSQDDKKGKEEKNELQKSTNTDSIATVPSVFSQLHDIFSNTPIVTFSYSQSINGDQPIHYRSADHPHVSQETLFILLKQYKSSIARLVQIVVNEYKEAKDVARIQCEIMREKEVTENDKDKKNKVHDSLSPSFDPPLSSAEQLRARLQVIISDMCHRYYVMIGALCTTATASDTSIFRPGPNNQEGHCQEDQAIGIKAVPHSMNEGTNSLFDDALEFLLDGEEMGRKSGEKEHFRGLASDCDNDEATANISAGKEQSKSPYQAATDVICTVLAEHMMKTFLLHIVPNITSSAGTSLNGVTFQEKYGTSDLQLQSYHPLQRCIFSFIFSFFFGIDSRNKREIITRESSSDLGTTVYTNGQEVTILPLVCRMLLSSHNNDISSTTGGHHSSPPNTNIITPITNFATLCNGYLQEDHRHISAPVMPLDGGRVSTPDNSLSSLSSSSPATMAMSNGQQQQCYLSLCDAIMTGVGNGNPTTDADRKDEMDGDEAANKSIVLGETRSRNKKENKKRGRDSFCCDTYPPCTTMRKQQVLVPPPAPYHLQSALSKVNIIERKKSGNSSASQENTSAKEAESKDTSANLAKTVKFRRTDKCNRKSTRRHHEPLSVSSICDGKYIVVVSNGPQLSPGNTIGPSITKRTAAMSTVTLYDSHTNHPVAVLPLVEQGSIRDHGTKNACHINSMSRGSHYNQRRQSKTNYHKTSENTQYKVNLLPNTATGASRIFGTGSFEERHGPICCRYIASNTVAHCETVLVSGTPGGDKHQQKSRTCTVGYCAQVSESPEFAVPLESLDDKGDTDEDTKINNPNQGHHGTSFVSSRFLMVTAGPFEVYRGKSKRRGSSLTAKRHSISEEAVSTDGSNDSPASRVCWTNSSDTDSLDSVDDAKNDNDAQPDRTCDSGRARNTNSVIRRSTVPRQEQPPRTTSVTYNKRGRKNKMKISKQKSRGSTSSSSSDNNEEEQEPYYLPSKVAIFDLFSLLSTPKNKTAQYTPLQPIKTLFPITTHRHHFRPLAIDTVIDGDTLQSIKSSPSLRIHNRLLSKPRKFQYFKEILGSPNPLVSGLSTIDPVLALLTSDEKGDRRRRMATFSTVMDSSVWIFDKSLRWMWWHWHYNQYKLQKEEGEKEKKVSAIYRERLPSHNGGSFDRTNGPIQIPPSLNCKDRGVAWGSLEAEWRYHLHSMEAAQILLPRQNPSPVEVHETNDNHYSPFSNTPINCCLFTCLQCLTATDFTILRWLPISGILLQNITVPYATRSVTFTPYKGGSIVVLDEHNDLSLFSVYNYHRNINYIEMGALERSRRGKEGKERRQVAREAQRLVAREAGGGESDAAARLASQLLSRSRRGGGWWTKDSVFPPSTAPRLTLNSNWMNWDSKRFGSRGENYDIGNCTVSQRRDETVATFVAILASMRSKAGKEKIKKRRKDYQSSPSSDLVLPSNTQLDSTDPFGLRAFDPTPAETAQFVQQLRQQWLEEGADKWDGQQQILYHHTDCIPTTVSTEGLLPVVSNMGTWSANTAATFNQSLQRGVDQEAYRDKGKLSSASSAKKRRFYSSSQSYLLLSAATGSAMSINERMRVRAVLLNNIISSSASRTWRQRDIHSSATALKAFFRRLTMPQSTLCIAETYDHSDFDWWERKKGQSIHRQEQQHSYKRNPQRSPSVLWSAVPSIRWLTLEETHVGQRILGYELLMDKHEEFNQVGRKDRKRGKTERVENEGDKFMKMMKIISWNKQTNQRDKQIATQEPVSDQEIIDREGKSKDASIECQTHDTITEESTSHGGNCKRIDRSRGSSYLGVDFIRKLFGVYDNSEVCVSGVASERDMGVIRPPLSNNEEYTNSTDPPVFWPKNFPHALTQRCLADVTLLDDEIEQCTSSIEGDICFPWRMEEDDKDCVSQKYMDYNEDTLNSHSSMKMDEDGCVIRQKSSEEGIAYDPFIRLVLSFGVLFHNRQDMAHALMHETKQLCVPKRLRKPGRGGEDRQWTDGSDDDSNAFDGEDGEIEAEAAAHIGQRHRAKILSIFGASSMEEWTLLNVSVSTVVNGNGMLNDNCNGRFIAMTAVLRSTRTEYLETMRMMPAQPLRGYYGVFVLDMDNLQLVSFFPVCDVLPSLKGLNGVAGSHNNLDDQLLSVWPRLLDSTSPPSEREKGSIVSSARDGADNISDEGPLACVLLGPFDSSSKVYDSARCTTVKNGSARRKVSKKVQDRTTKKNYAQNIQPILSNCRQYAYSHQRQLLKRLVNKLTVQGGNSSEEETDTIPEELSTEMSDEVHLAHQCAAIGEILSSIEHSGDTNGVALPITAKEMYFERLFLQKENITANKNSPVDFGGFGREVLYKLPVTIVTIIPPCTNVQSPPIYNDNIPLLRVFVGTLDDTTIQHDGYTGAVVEEYTPGLVSGVGVFLPEQPPDQVIIGTSKISTPRETAAVNEGGNSDNRLVISLNVDDWRKLRGSRDPVRKETTGKATELDENKSRNDNRECVGGIYNDTRFGSPNIEEKRRKIEKERIAIKKKQQKRLEDPCSDYWRLSYPYGSNSNGWTCSGEIDKCITVSGDDDFPNQELLIGSLHSAEELLNIAVASSSYDSNTRRKIMNAVNNYPMTTANAESHTATILSASVGLAQHLFTAITTGGNSESEITGVLLELANAGSGGDTRAFTAHHRELYSMLASTVSCLLPFHSLYKRHLQNGIYPSPYSMSDNCTSSEGAASALILTHQLQPIYEFNVVTLALKLLFRDPLPQVVRTHQQACKHEYYCNKKLERLKSEEEKMVLMAEKKRDNVANGNAGRKEHTKHSSPSTRHITVYGSDTDDNERATNNTYEEELEGTHHQEITGQNNHHMQLQQLIHILQQEHRNATRHRFGVCRAPYGAVNSVAVVPYTSEGSGCQGAVKLKVVSAGERGFVWLW